MWSSANPEKISRSIKWGIGAVLFGFVWAGFDNDVIAPMLYQVQDQVPAILTAASQFLGDGIALFTKLAALWFTLAKIWNTVKAKPSNYEPML